MARPRPEPPGELFDLVPPIRWRSDRRGGLVGNGRTGRKHKVRRFRDGCYSWQCNDAGGLPYTLAEARERAEDHEREKLRGRGEWVRGRHTLAR